MIKIGKSLFVFCFWVPMSACVGVCNTIKTNQIDNRWNYSYHSYQMTVGRNRDLLREDLLDVSYYKENELMNFLRTDFSLLNLDQSDCFVTRKSVLRVPTPILIFLKKKRTLVPPQYYFMKIKSTLLTSWDWRLILIVLKWLFLFVFLLYTTLFLTLIRECTKSWNNFALPSSKESAERGTIVTSYIVIVRKIWLLVPIRPVDFLMPLQSILFRRSIEVIVSI